MYKTLLTKTLSDTLALTCTIETGVFVSDNGHSCATKKLTSYRYDMLSGKGEKKTLEIAYWNDGRVTRQSEHYFGDFSTKKGWCIRRKDL